MANWYVWSGAAGGGTGADWANAYVKLDTAIGLKPAGDVFFVAHDHVQTQGSALALTALGTEINPHRIYCVNRAGSVPPVSADLRTTAQVSTTGAFNITMGGSVSECYGIIFSAGSAASAASIIIANVAARSWRLVNCQFILANTSTSSRITPGAAGSLVTLENCTMQFGAVGQGIGCVGRVIWRNTPSALAGAIFPTTLFLLPTVASSTLVEGVDLSALGSGKNLVSVTTTNVVQVVFKDCKLGAVNNIVTGAIPGQGSSDVMLIRSDSSDTNYRVERHNYLGRQITETTVVHSGGASDGVTPLAWRVESNTGSSPFESLPISIWNETVGSPITVALECIASGTTRNNGEIWMDVFYLGTSGFPFASKATSGRATRLDAATTYPVGSGTWGGGQTHPFAMSVTITPQEKGPITIYVQTLLVGFVYIDPKPVIT